MQRWRIVFLLAAVAAVVATPARAAPECADLWEWLNTGCRRVVDTYQKGNNEVLVSGFAWHTPWTWTSERRAEENQYAWGGGWARSLDRENGDTDTVYFLVFSDSHYEPEFNLGYGWTTWWRPRDSLQPGLGDTDADLAAGHLGRRPFSRHPAAGFAALRPGHRVLDLYPDPQRRHQPRQHPVRLRENRDRSREGCPHERPHHRRRRPRTRTRVEDRAVASRRQVFVAPGNAGTALEPELTNVAITAIPELVAFAQQQHVALTVVGPEGPLAAGVVDAFRVAGLAIFGPLQAAARLESSKDYAKAFMARHGIPTAQSRTFTETQSARAYVTERGAPIVVKADGLAAGKGVIVATTVADAHAATIRRFTPRHCPSGGCAHLAEMPSSEPIAFRLAPRRQDDRDETTAHTTRG